MVGEFKRKISQDTELLHSNHRNGFTVWELVRRSIIAENLLFIFTKGPNGDFLLTYGKLFETRKEIQFSWKQV